MRKYELPDHLEKADYIFIPSRRIFSTHMRPDMFPLTNRYYQALFSGELGFKPLVTISTLGSQRPTIPGLVDRPYTPEDIFIQDEAAEETWTVFDHPIIRIYEKTTPKTTEEYGSILNIM